MNDYWQTDYELTRLVNEEATRRADALSSATTYKIKRAMIRASRIAAGLALAFVAFVIIWNIKSVRDVPFASLTLGMLAGNAAGWIFGLGFIWWAFVAAFGAAPTKQQLIDAQRANAEETVKAAKQLERMNT